MKAKVLLVAALFMVGCAEDAVESGGDPNATESVGGKGDCFDCDTDSTESAFEQLGIGAGFWRTGDWWEVAYLLNTDDRVQMQPLEFGQEIKPNAGMVVLRFEVVDQFRINDGDLLRPTVTIRITQTEGTPSVQQYVEAVEIQADINMQQIELVIDDLFRPVGVREFTQDFPNGRYFEQDGNAVVRNTTSGFPYVVPNVHLNPNVANVPVLPPELHVIAQEIRPGYETEVFSEFAMGAFELAGEVVYWADGDLWPFLVETPSAVGVLVAQGR